MDLAQRCDPGGAAPTDWAVVGEGPGADEVRENRGFVGQSGELLWPMVQRFAGLKRGQCWDTNVSKYRLDDALPSDKKLKPAEFERCRAERPSHRLVLAGGLNPSNLAGAVERLHPWAVDLNSGVESAPGQKDPAKLRAAFAVLSVP